MKKIVNSIYDVYSGKLPCSFDGMKIAMLSDLHDNVYGISLEKLYGMIGAGACNSGGRSAHTKTF